VDPIKKDLKDITRNVKSNNFGIKFANQLTDNLNFLNALQENPSHYPIPQILQQLSN